MQKSIKAASVLLRPTSDPLRREICVRAEDGENLIIEISFSQLVSISEQMMRVVFSRFAGMK